MVYYGRGQHRGTQCSLRVHEAELRRRLCELEQKGSETTTGWKVTCSCGGFLFDDIWENSLLERPVSKGLQPQTVPSWTPQLGVNRGCHGVRSKYPGSDRASYTTVDVLEESEQVPLPSREESLITVGGRKKRDS